MKTHTFTPSDFKHFAAKVQWLVSKMGLTEWHLSITHEQIGSGVAAQTQYNTVSKNASIRLTINSDGDYGFITDVEQLAIHEVLHLAKPDLIEDEVIRMANILSKQVWKCGYRRIVKS